MKDEKLIRNAEREDSSNVATSENGGYYVNIDGEDIEVDAETEEEYSCILNCLEGYFYYGNGDDEEEYEEDDEKDNLQ